MKRARFLYGVVLVASLLSLAAILRDRQPANQKPQRAHWERPAKKMVENIPPTANPPPARDRSARRAAFISGAPVTPPWTFLGPAPIPNGQTENRTDPVSGRVTSIAVHPLNPAIAYVGTAQGGLYRTLDAGTSWVQLMDNAEPGIAGTPLAIGSVVIDPDPAGNFDNVFVGTGEGNLSGDSYFGCGLYIITNASGTQASVNGPYNLRPDGVDVFTGRSITAVVVDPADHDNVFVATTSGFGGIVPSSYSILPERGLYRSTNALVGITGTGTPTFTRLVVQPAENNAITSDAVIEPGNANTVLCGLYSQGTGTGGVYRSSDALSASPTFTRTLALPDGINLKLAINKVGDAVTVYAATEEGSPNGRLYRSTDGGVTWGPALSAADGFAGTQGFYNIAVAVHPNDGSRVYLGGQLDRNIFLFSTDGGNTFGSSITGLHVDTHAIALAPSNPSVIYHGNDGGVWRSTNSGASWIPLNNSTFSATQFMGIALHPSDRYLSLGGTQDNGTELLHPDRTITRADFGDGGYTLIDQNAIDAVSVTMYHTYFNATGLILGTARVLSTNCATEGNWSLHGAFDGPVTGPYCDGSFDTKNGINLSDDTNFYAPQVLGPGNPNTWYFGSDRLYRSIDRADTAATVSQSFSVPISAIAISPQDDNLRIVGLNDGRVFATVSGASPLVQVAGLGASRGTNTTPRTGVGRIAVDPNNSAVAYLCFAGYGTPDQPLAHVWKTTDLYANFVTWVPVSQGLPDAPVNAIAIDGVTVSDSVTTDIYVGTDIGVYYSGDAGQSWSLYGQGLPRVAVFGLEIQSPARLVRVATHGRGLYETATVSTATPTPTPTPEPKIDPSTKLVNLSTRGPVRAGSEVMIAGLIVQGEGTKRVVLRGIGPSMFRSGVFDAVFDPRLSVYNVHGVSVASNDDYVTNSSADRITLASSGLTPSDARESAIVTSFSPGAYTSILEATSNGSALVEAYDITPARANRLLNISTRLKVEAGDPGAAIAGFIINTPAGGTPTSKRVVVRVRGPSLQGIGISGALSDPTLEFYQGTQLVTSNDNWRSNSQSDQQQLTESGFAPQNDREPALILTLAPGSYSSVVRGRNNSTGVVLAEVYQVSE